MSERPLRQDAHVDEPGLVGARWWQDSVVDPVGRRTTILALLAVGGGLAVAGIAIEACEPTKEQRLGALALQRKYGWSFGAAAESLVFNGVSTEPFDRSRIPQMVTDLAPRAASHRPFYVQTLFESPTSLPQATSEADPTPIASLKDALKPIFTNGMRDMFKLAQGIAQLLAETPGTAAVVDLDGQDAVAFAAGASQAWDPVFLFDNWPHPHGVVPAHLTLAAAAYYQPLFARAQGSAPRDAPPMFVLDRQRLATYRDDATQFDNRWVARMPGRDALKSLGIHRLLYVAPAPAGHAPWELDDLNDDLVTDAIGGVAIVAVDVSALDPNHPPTTAPGVPYSPAPRKTQFSTGGSGTSGVVARPTPPEFGSVPVAVALVGGAVLGVRWSRSGTWNRGGGWGGG